MKTLILLTITILSTGVFAADWNTLKRSAEEKIIGSTVQIPGLSYEYDYVTKSPVKRIELNRIDYPFAKFNAAAIDALETVASSQDDFDWVEIFMYTDKEVVNCYAAFDNGVFSRVDKCSYKIKK